MTHWAPRVFDLLDTLLLLLLILATQYKKCSSNLSDFLLRTECIAHNVGIKISNQNQNPVLLARSTQIFSFWDFFFLFFFVCKKYVKSAVFGES